MKSKTSIGIIVAVVFVVVLFAASFIAGPQTVPAKVQLQEEISRDVERAQRMLLSYQPSATRLLVQRRLHQKMLPKGEKAQAPSSQPSDYDSNSPLVEEMSQQQRRLQQLQRDVEGLGGARPLKGREAGSFDEYKNKLEQNEQVLSEALQIVRQAINKQAQDGTEIVRGSMHPEATKLEAMLIFHQANMLANKAEAYREAAHDQRMRFYRTAGYWEQIDTQTESLARSLVGGLPAKSELTKTQPVFEQATTEQAEPTSRIDRKPQPRTEPRQQQTQPQQKGPQKKGKISKFFKNLMGNQGDNQPANNQGNASQMNQPSQQQTQQNMQQAQDQSQQQMQQLNEGQDREVGTQAGDTGAQPSTKNTAVAAQTEPAEIVFEQFATIDERMEELRDKRSATNERIRKTEREIEELQGIVDQLAAKVEKFENKAAEAEQRMMELEDKGIDPSEPESLRQYIKEYKEASETHREAWRKATLLREGALKNAELATEDENQLATAELRAEDPTKGIEPVRGLTSYRRDLQATQIVLKNEKDLLAQINAEIDRLIERKNEVQTGVKQLRADRGQISEKVRRQFQSVLELTLQADQLEQQALELIENEGLRAAERAARATSKVSSEHSQFVRAENSQKSPNPELTAMARSRSLTGHANTLKGDLLTMKAATLAQRVLGQQRHAEMLRVATRIKMPEARELLAEVTQQENLPEYLYSAEAAAGAAKEALAVAREAAEEALEVYNQADKDLDQLWTLHTSIGAVQHLLARLSTEKETRKQHLAQAVEQYRRSIHGREGRWETPVYQKIINDLKPELK